MTHNVLNNTIPTLSRIRFHTFKNLTCLGYKNTVCGTMTEIVQYYKWVQHHKCEMGLNQVVVYIHTTYSISSDIQRPQMWIIKRFFYKRTVLSFFTTIWLFLKLIHNIVIVWLVWCCRQHESENSVTHTFCNVYGRVVPLSTAVCNTMSPCVLP